MAAQQGIKRRIKSVTNTKQITKAMQLVAASKLRRAQESALGPKAYVAAARELLESIAATYEAQSHPLFQQRKVKTALTIAITSDRGLAGAYNGNVNRLLSSHAAELSIPHQVISVGKYAAQHVVREKNLLGIAAYDMECDDPDVMIAQPVLREAIDLFLAGSIDAVYIVYTQFKSTVSQSVVAEQLLPIQVTAHGAVNRTFEPGPEAFIDLAINRLLEAQVLQAVLESRASENASRMLAMKNATDNAGDLIEDLTLAFNNARQAAITQELAEISAGTEAING
jgi:F-type H+-transporting ATPase subunit gamma